MAFAALFGRRQDSGRRSDKTWEERITFGVLLLLTVAGLYCVTVNGLTFARGELKWGYAMTLFLAGFAGLPMGLVWMLTLRHKTVSWSRMRVAVFGIAWYACMAFLLAAPFNYWPVRLAFRLQQATLETIARNAEQGRVPVTPLRLGCYTITKVEKDSQGIVWVWVNPHGNEPSRLTAFAHCTAAELPPNTVLYPRGLTATVELAPDWFCLGYEG